jgi:predicted NBD/HSP70 family sugar kinase
VASPHPHHWRTAAAALAELRREPALTRAELSRRLRLESGPASDLMKRLTAADLIVERPAPPEGRGRPTTTVHASASGPLAAVLDLRHGDWRLGVCGVDGVVDLVTTGTHDGRPDAVLDVLTKRLRALARTHGDRLIGLGLAVPGPVADNRLVHATMLGWRDVDVARVSPRADLPVVVENDATMAAVAEARLHVPRPDTLLHIVVEIGVGGALVVAGRPVASAHGLHGEFGHLPFGEPGRRCPCGASGCWTVAFDAEQIARATRTTVPADPRSWLHDLFTDPVPPTAVRRLRTALAADLGRGIAGLVNALDPELVTLGGLAADVRSAAPEPFERALTDGLMSVHADQPPAIEAARGGEDAALIGLGLSVYDRVLDAAMLARWAGRVQVSA